MKIRRLLVVFLLYAVGAVLIDALFRALVPILVLPPLFLTLGRVVLALGLVVSLAAAWSYRTSGD